MSNQGVLAYLVGVLLIFVTNTFLFSQTVLYPYFELGTAYNNNINLGYEAIQENESLKYTFGATLSQSMTQYMTGKLAGFSDFDYFMDDSINSSSYQFLSASLSITPFSKLDIAILGSFLNYLPSDRDNKLKRYAVEPTFYYQIFEGNWLKGYFNREYYRYIVDINDQKDTYFIGYFLAKGPYTFHPFINYKRNDSYVENQFGLECVSTFYDRHQLVLRSYFARRSYGLEHGNKIENQYDFGIDYSYFLTATVSLNFNVNYLVISDLSGHHDVDNITSLLSVSWMPTWQLLGDEDHDDEGINSSDFKFDRARVFYQEKEYQKTINLLEEVITNDSSHFESYYLLAYAYIQLSDFDHALPYLIFLYEQTQDPNIELLIMNLNNI